MSAADERRKAIEMAKADFAKALLRAEGITEDWYRCQALASVARFAPDGEVMRIAEKALKAARLAGDAYKRVAVAAWPVAALAERRKTTVVRRVLGELLTEAQGIAHPVSRLNALELLYQAAWSLPPTEREPVLDAFLRACAAADSWQAGRAVEQAAYIMANDDIVRAREIAATMQDSPHKRRTLRNLDAGVTASPRAFFG